MRHHEAGASLIIVVLGTLLVLALVIAMTSTVTLRTTRTSADNQAALGAQYASEAALARARSIMAIHARHLQSLTIKKGTTHQALMAQLGSLCNTGPLTLPENITMLPADGQDLCRISPIQENDNARLGFFVSNSVNTGAMTNSQWVEYWKTMLRGHRSVLLTEEQTSHTYSFGSSVRTVSEVTGGIVPDSIRVYPTGALRIMMQVTPITATTRVLAGNREIARKRYVEGTTNSIYTELSQPPFSQYQYFVNRRLTPSGSRLVFWDQDRFEGRVHANGTGGVDAPLFYATTSTGGPRFQGKYTSTANLEWSTSTPAKAPESQMFQGGAAFGVDRITLPGNANNQRLAAAGLATNQQPRPACLNAADPITMCLRQTFTTATSLPDGVYASRPGESTFAGGIYVKGNVADLKVTRSDNLQTIAITQGTTTTMFRQVNATKWEVYRGSTLVSTLNNSFNGMLFVDGQVGTANPKGTGGLRGDGTSAGDLAGQTQLTVAASSDIFIKDNLTYADSPSSPEAKNVLGVYSEAGNIKVNGPENQDLIVDATLMAAAPGKGFGTVDFQTSRGSPQPKVRIMGGIIEEQSQGVGTTSRLVPVYRTERVCVRENANGSCREYRNYQVLDRYEEQAGAGYSRDFRWDARFNNRGFAPPFFPTQQNYEISSSEGLGKALVRPGGFKAEASP
ncbi:hypothetical protein DEDE109153_11660 [Deinococcus deserti]